jgi:transcriptional/translational regulatory protein YebC/TACO1
MFQFKHVGALVYPLAVATAERMEELAIEAGADDVQSDPDEGHRVLTAPADLAVVKNAMAAALGEPESAELTFVPIQTQVVEDEAVLEALGAMVGMLEEDGDVQEVITNLAEPSI